MISVIEIDKQTVKRSSRLNNRITKIVMHDTAGLMPGCLEWLQIDRAPPVKDDVSCHILVDKLGNAYRLVPDEYTAWHCRGHNSQSLGLELERAKLDEDGDYPPEQIITAAKCVALWCRKFSIPIDRIFAHKELSTTGKTDPRNFPWYEFLTFVAEIIIVDRVTEI